MNWLCHKSRHKTCTHSITYKHILRSQAKRIFAFRTHCRQSVFLWILLSSSNLIGALNIYMHHVSANDNGNGSSLLHSKICNNMVRNLVDITMDLTRNLSSIRLNYIDTTTYIGDCNVHDNKIEEHLIFCVSISCEIYQSLDNLTK